ncbi:MAG: DUF922 domain-containing protein [Pseudomonadota bacterium]
MTAYKLSFRLSLLCGLVALTSCATTMPLGPILVDPALRSQFTIPETLPDLDDPLGFLRPDATQSRDDVFIRIEDYTVTEHKADTVLTGRNGIQAALTQNGWDYIARVDWRIRWDYDLEKRGDYCVVEGADTELTVTYALPIWEPSETPHPGLKAYWEDFELALWIHEYGHAKIGYDTKNRIETAILNPPFQEFSCQAMARQLNEMARAMIDQGVDAAYDDVTDHGMTQGAVYDVLKAQQAVGDYKAAGRS